MPAFSRSIWCGMFTAAFDRAARAQFDRKFDQKLPGNRNKTEEFRDRKIKAWGSGLRGLASSFFCLQNFQSKTVLKPTFFKMLALWSGGFSTAFARAKVL